MPQAQGSLGRIVTQMEAGYKTALVAIQSRKCYFTNESLRFSQELVQSRLIRGSSRQPTQGILGNTDVAGNINTELITDSFLWYAGLGDCGVTWASFTEGSDLAPTAGTIDAVNQTLTLTKTTHGVTLPGGTYSVAGLTSPTSLNGQALPVIAIPDANTIVLRIPAGTSTTYTKGSGTFKPMSGTGIATYTYKGGGKLPSYVIEKGFTDIAQYFKYTGCVCGQLGFSFPNSGLLNVTSTWMGGAESYSTSSFETGTTVDNGAAKFDSFKLAAADMKEGGSAIAYVTQVQNLTIDNQLDGDTFVLGGAGARSAINPGTFRVSGTLTAFFQDTTLYAKAKNSTESSLDMTFKRGTGAGSATNEYFQIVVPELTFSPSAPAIEGPSGVLMNLNFEGFYDNHADATALKIVVKSPLLPGAVW